MQGKGEVILYKTEDGQTQVDVLLDNNTVWLTQSQLTRLFNQTKQNISLHINNIFKEGELPKSSVVKKSLTTASDKKKYKTISYNLDVIISVGYRVKSKRGTLKDHLVKGYAINEKRLQEQQEKFKELHQTVDQLLRNILKTFLKSRN